MGLGHPRPPVPGRRQVQHRPAGGRVRRLLGAGRLRRCYAPVVVLHRADAVLAMSPPLSLGLTGWLVGVVRGAPLVFNVQDIFPDAAVRTGAIRNRRVIAVAAWLERHHLSPGGGGDGAQRRPAAQRRRQSSAMARRDTVHVIPNFVDTDVIRPLPRMTRYRAELGIGDEPVVLYAGNVGFSQSLDLVVEAARRLPDVTFLINGDGAARPELERGAAGVPNVRFAGYQPASRLAEVLATGDVHVVPLRAGLGDVSVPSKTYSSLAAGRPVVASIDLDSEIPRLLADAGRRHRGRARRRRRGWSPHCAPCSTIPAGRRRWVPPGGRGPSARRRRRRSARPTTSCCATSSPAAAG